MPLDRQRVDERLLQAGDVVEGDVERAGLGRGRGDAVALPPALPLQSTASGDSTAAASGHVLGRRRTIAEHPLQAVDRRRIVRGGDDRAAVGVQPMLRIVDHRRGQQPEVDDVEPLMAQTVDQRRQRTAASIRGRRRRRRTWPPAATAGPRPRPQASYSAADSSVAASPRMSQGL